MLEQKQNVVGSNCGAIHYVGIGHYKPVLLSGGQLIK